MQGVNKVIIIGSVGKDPIQGGQIGGTTHFCKLTIATNRKWTDKKSGEKCEETEWHRVIAWGKLAALWMQYVEKGSSLYVEGRLKTSKYQKNGVDHYSTDIVAEQFTFLSSSQRGVASGTRQQTNPVQRAQSNHRQHDMEKQECFIPQAGDNDIPF